MNRENRIRLEIYNSAGISIKALIDGEFPEGQYRLIWNGDNNQGHDITNGIYFYKITTGTGTVQTGKVVLIN